MRDLSRYLLIACAVVGFATPANAASAPDGNSVLILASTNGIESAIAGSVLGYTVVIDDDATWLARTTAEFASFKAIILGDNYCGSSYGAAEANRATWSPAITGNVVVVGTDPSFHSSYYAGTASQGDAVTEKGIAFAAAEAGKTGAYIALSCAFGFFTPSPVDLLDQFGTFLSHGVDCFGAVHIVAEHDALDGLTDANLSDWFCSAHEAFSSFPSDFLPLAIALDVGCGPGETGGINFGDGTCGTPYILARGEDLTPVACGDGILNTEVGEECDDGNTENGDLCSAQCKIEIPTGPVCGDGVIEGSEQCDDGNAVGGDGCSAVCTIENEAPICADATVSAPMLWPPNHQMVPVSINVTDPDGDVVSVVATAVSQDEVVNETGKGAGNTSPDASLAPLAVRAERNGNPKTPGNGRVYHISFTASDEAGASCTGEVTVCVPHDQGKGATCVDGGALYSSIP